MKAKSSSKNLHQKTLIVLLIYAAAISLLISSGINHDAELDSKYTSLPQSSSGGLIFGLFVIYLFRLAVLFGPDLLGRLNIAKGWIIGGIAGSLLPEAALVITGLSLSYETTKYCVSGGDFGNCGWGALQAFIFLFSACFFQLVGMVVGASIYARRKKK